MKGIEAMLDEIERHTTTAGRKSLMREVRAEVRRIVAEREAARAAVKLCSSESPLVMVIHPTRHLTELDGVPVRIWEGITADGIHCHVFVHRLAVGGAADQLRFESELIEVAGPDQPIDILSFLERLEGSRDGLDTR